MKVLIEIDEEEYKTLSSLSDREKVNDLMGYEKIIANGTPLNGTNGDVLKAVLNWKDDVICSTTDEKLILDNSVNRNIIASISLDWWNADYKGVE